MTKLVTLSTKGQLTVPMGVRRKMGLDKVGATARLEYDVATNRLYIEKVADIDTLHTMNRAILQRTAKETSLKAGQPGMYRTGDGFKAYVAKKYGSKL